jgi:type IV pilus assembly protein PilM
MCLELYEAIEQSLNRKPELLEKTPQELPYKDRMDFHITRVEQQYFDNLATWYSKDLKSNYADELKSRQQAGFAKETRPADKDPDPTGPGWVVELRGYHYYNGTEKKGTEGAAHVTNYLIDFLENGKVTLPSDKPGEMKEISMYDLGVRRPVLRNKDARPDYKYRVRNPEYDRILVERGITPPSAGGALGGGGKPSFGGTGGKPSFGGTGGGGGGGSGAGTMMEEEGSGGNLAGGGFGGGALGGGAAPMNPSEPIKDAAGNLVPMDFEAPKFEFVVQFAWKPGDLATATGPAVAAPAAAPPTTISEDTGDN